MEIDKLTEENKRKLEYVVSLTKRAIRIGGSALTKFPTDEYDLLVFTFINYLERFTYSLDAIVVLLEQFKTKSSVETAIGLSIRASLLDFMTVTFLSTYQADITTDNQEAQEEFDRQFDAFISDQIHNTIKYLEHMRDHGLISLEEFETTIKNLNHTYNFLFNGLDLQNPISTLKTKMFKSPKQMFSRIHHHHLTRKFSMVYDLYTYYSKYEHFGIMTHFMQRDNINTDFERIIYGINYIIRGIGASLAYLNYPVEKVINEMSEMDKLIVEFDQL